MRKSLVFLTIILAGLLISCSDDDGGGGVSCPVNYTNAQHDSQLLNFAHQQNSNFGNGQAVVNTHCVRNDIAQLAFQQGIGNGTNIGHNGNFGGGSTGNSQLDQFCDQYAQSQVGALPEMYSAWFNFCTCSYAGVNCN